MKALGCRLRSTTLTLLMGGSLLLGGCSVLPRAQPVDVYALPAVESAASASAPVPAAVLASSLRVARPLAPASLAGKRLLVQPAAGEPLQAYQGMRWQDSVPELVRASLLAALRGDGRIAALSSDAERLQADYELASELLAFQAEYVGAQQVEAVFSLNVRLVQRAGRRIVASRVFTTRNAAASPAVADVVAAMGESSAELSAALLAWTVAEVAAREGQP